MWQIASHDLMAKSTLPCLNIQGKETLLWGKQKQHIKCHAVAMFIVQCMLDKIKTRQTKPESFFCRQAHSTPGNRIQKKNISDGSFDCLQKNPHTFFVSGIESGWWQELAETKPP